MSLGGLSSCEAQLADALNHPYTRTVEHVRQQDVAYADETGWRRGNRQRGWLWALCCAEAAVFMVHAERGQMAARKLLGAFCGVLVSDRWGGYSFFCGIRQICWAHLKRDFKAISEAKGATRLGDPAPPKAMPEARAPSRSQIGKIGQGLYGLAKKILKMRKRVRDGTLQRRTFQNRMIPLMNRAEELLEQAAKGRCALSGKPAICLAGKCRRIIKHREHLWTFVQDQSVDPTNNLAERIVRQGVLWHKNNFGTQSERGAHYVERILTVCATCRLQSRSVIEYLRYACCCHLNGFPAPSLIKTAGTSAKTA